MFDDWTLSMPQTGRGVKRRGRRFRAGVTVSGHLIARAIRAYR
jgi:hypothetical protein